MIKFLKSLFSSPKTEAYDLELEKECLDYCRKAEEKRIQEMKIDDLLNPPF